LVHQRAGDRHPLALPARQLVRPVRHPVGEPDVLERPGRLGTALLRGHARVNQRQLDVVEGTGARQQVEGLEHEPDLFVADPRQFIVGQIAHLLTVEPVFAPRRRVEAADEVHERRFPRTRRAHDGHELVALHLDLDAAQRVHHLAAHVVVARQLVREDDGIGQRRVAGAERGRLDAGHRACPTSASTWARAIR